MRSDGNTVSTIV